MSSATLISMNQLSIHKQAYISLHTIAAWSNIQWNTAYLSTGEEWFNEVENTIINGKDTSLLPPIIINIQTY